MAYPHTIVLADDHEVVRNGLRSYLEKIEEFQVVGEAANGEEAVKLVAEYIPDLVVIDLIMPGMDSVEVIRLISRISPRSKVVVLTSYHDNIRVFPALKAGAIAYLLKNTRMEKLADALRRAVRGELALHPLVAKQVLLSVQSKDSREQPLFTKLTGRELDVLKLIANGLSNSLIAQNLAITEHTVKGHVSNILHKLHLADRTQVAVYAWQKGIVCRDVGE